MKDVSTHVRRMILCFEGSIRPDLEETPDRVSRAWAEMLDGYSVDVPKLFKAFDGEGADQIVAVKDIQTWSVCEHHLLPFECSVAIAYLPVKKVIGASKLVRLANAYAHRLQLQERIARQIAESMMENLQPKGVAVVIEGTHGCMRCRGVRNDSSKLVNSIMLGAFRTENSARMEVLSLLGVGR